MWTRALLLSLPMAGFAAATDWRDIEPDALQAAVAVVWVAGPAALGAAAGWRALPCFAVVYAAAAVALEHIVYHPPRPYDCDPFCSSPTTGLVLALPVWLVLIALGRGAAVVVARVRAPRTRTST